MKDLRLIVSLKNNILVKEREKKNFNQAQMAEYCGIQQSLYGLYENLKEKPFNKKLQYSKAALKMAARLKTTPEELFPEQIYKLEKRKVEREISSFQIMSLTNDNYAEFLALSCEEKEIKKERILTVRKQLETILTPKEIDVLKQRYGFDGEEKTAEEVAKDFDVCNARIWQIEKRALSKLRNNRKISQLSDPD